MAGSVYVEDAPPAALAAVVACTWRRRTHSAGDLVILPDGCVDLVASSDGRVFVAGPDRGPAHHRTEAGLTYAGVRLRPGVAETVLGVPADALCDAQPDLTELWGGTGTRAADRLLRSGGTATRVDRWLGLVEERLAGGPGVDAAVRAAVALLEEGVHPVGALGPQVGLSERQLHRRVTRQVGYSPKVLDRVLRFRRFLARGADAASGATPLAVMAAEVGYADQAHLARECRRLAGATPTALALRGSGA